MPNMTPEELHAEIKGYFDAAGQAAAYDWEKCVADYTDNIIQLFTDLCGEVIGPKTTSNQFYQHEFNAGYNHCRKGALVRLTKLTGKEMNQ